jgi:hypothetical protein
MGYCCAGGKISQTNRAQCRGNFFADEATARNACTAPPEQGYCCAGGKVSQTTRDRCGGTFARSQADAQRACRVVQVDPKPDSGLKDRITKQPPEGPVVR